MFVAEKDGHRLEVAEEVMFRALLTEGWTEVQPSVDVKEDSTTGQKSEKPKRRARKTAQ